LSDLFELFSVSEFPPAQIPAPLFTAAAWAFVTFNDVDPRLYDTTSIKMRDAVYVRFEEGGKSAAEDLDFSHSRNMSTTCGGQAPDTTNAFSESEFEGRAFASLRARQRLSTLE
jgi:hypothetical protein